MGGWRREKDREWEVEVGGSAGLLVLMSEIYRLFFGVLWMVWDTIKTGLIGT
jgi:hypothetical protein